MHETHQIEESLSFRPAECLTPCPSSAASIRICLFLREQLPQKSVGVILILKLNLCVNYLPEVSPAPMSGERAPYSLHRTAGAQGKQKEEPTSFAREISDTASLVLHIHNALHSRAQSCQPLLCPGTDAPTADLQHRGTCTQQNHLNLDTKTHRV